MRWWESPFVLAFGGAMAVHVLLVVALDVVVVYNPPSQGEIAPHVELVDLEPPPPPPKLAPPPPSLPRPELPAPKPAPPERVASREPHPATPAQPEVPPPPIPPPSGDPAGGHEQVWDLPEDSNRDGVGKHGARTDDRIGPRGHGSGTGVGSGSGSGEMEAARPVSVATIKTAAKPKRDYAYFDDAKRYPEEAKQLGIEGDLKVQLIVDETGKIKKSRLLTHLGHGLDELALEHAAQLEFEPARDTDDRAVTSVVVWTFHMTLPK